MVRVERKCEKKLELRQAHLALPEDDMPFLWNVAVTCGAADKYPVQTFGLHLRSSARRTRHPNPVKSSPRFTTCMFYGGIAPMPLFLANFGARHGGRSSSPFCSIDGWKCKNRSQSDGPPSRSKWSWIHKLLPRDQFRPIVVCFLSVLTRDCAGWSDWLVATYVLGNLVRMCVTLFTCVSVHVSVPCIVCFQVPSFSLSNHVGHVQNASLRTRKDAKGHANDVEVR